MNYRIAEPSGFEQLANLRWDFRMETGEEGAAMTREDFILRYVDFFEEKAVGDYHVYWVAEEEGEIIAQIFVHIVEMIPRPCKINDRLPE